MATTLISAIHWLLPVATFVGQVIVVVGLILLVYEKYTKKPLPFLNFVADRALVFSFTVALVATMGSLFYSEVAMYEPCKLCWFERIFMYPQAFILGLALYVEDVKTLRYSLLLSIFGILFCIYHYLLQIGVISVSNCAVGGFTVSCSEYYTVGLGYVTIPLEALTAFAMILLFAGIKLVRNR